MTDFIVIVLLTRKLSYHKDDRAMRPVYECPENFRESLNMPTAIFPEILTGFLPMDAMDMRTKSS